MSISTAAVPVVRARSRRVSHGLGFWVVAGAFLVSTSFSVVPTPLWTLYQHRDGFSTFMVTVVFAAYAVGVMISLFFAGHLSDSLGRRRILLPAIGLEVVSALLFIGWPTLPGLLIARVILGLGIGMFTATATAHILDLHLRARPESGIGRGQLVAGAVNLGGFGLGALISGALAQWGPAPLVTPYVVFLVLLVLSGVGVALVPETVARPAVRAAYRPQRVRVPREARGLFSLAAAIAFVAFGVLGLFTSLAPAFVSGTLGITSHLVAGAVVFATFASAAVAQIAFRALSVRGQVALGAALLIAGVVVLTVSVETGTSLALFFAGGIVSGAGGGTLFKAALAVAAPLAAPQYRGEVLAGIFLAAYIGLAAPVVGIGVATLSISLTAALLGFAVVIVAVALAAALPLVALLRRRR
jgi:predicted MFS family arabinose efflux permease